MSKYENLSFSEELFPLHIEKYTQFLDNHFREHTDSLIFFI